MIRDRDGAERLAPMTTAASSSVVTSGCPAFSSAAGEAKTEGSREDSMDEAVEQNDYLALQHAASWHEDGANNTCEC